MPVIKNYQRQTQAVGPTRGPTFTADQFGAASGRALQNFSNTVGRVGESLTKAIDQKNTSDTNLQLAKASADLSADLQNRIRTADPGDSKVFDEYNKSVEDTLSKIGEDASSPSARRLFNESSLRIKSQLLRTSSESQADLAGVKGVTNYTEGLNANSAAVTTLPNSLETQLKLHSDSVDSLVETQLLPKSKAAQLKAQGEETIARSAMLGWIRLKPDYARQKLDSGELDKFLGSSKAGLYNRLDALDNQKKHRVSTIEKLKFKQPWSYFTEKGETYSTLDLGDPNSIGESLINRSDFIDSMGSKYGLRKDEVPFLDPNEAKAVADFLKDSDAKGTNAFLMNLDKNANVDIQKRIAEQVFKVDPGMGIALSVSSEAPDVSQGIIAGRKLFESNMSKGGETGKGGFLQPSNNEVKEVFDAYVSTSIPDPDLRRKIRDAAFYHYTDKQFKNAGDLAALDESDFKDSIEQITGPRVDINGKPIFSFRDDSGKFVQANEVAYLFDNLTDDLLLKSQGSTMHTLSGERVNVEKTQGRLEPVQVGDGLYKVLREGEVLLDENKREFELDLKKVIKESRRRQKENFKMVPNLEMNNRRGAPL